MKMNREVFTSKDGSKTLYWKHFDEHYHSVNGAQTESLHVFIEAGLNFIEKEKKSISILEMGFGTGLNALLTYKEAVLQGRSIRYTSLEAYPLSLEEIEQLNLAEMTGVEQAKINEFHTCEWDFVHQFDSFSFEKKNCKLEDYQPSQRFDLVYYDAFAPSAQPELWSLTIFEKLYQMLNKNGILVTYCAKGQVKRDLKAAGFEVQALPGPPGKREMTRAIKQ